MDPETVSLGLEYNPNPAMVGLSMLLPGIGSFIGAERANRTNVRMAREQMAFQERMSSTAWQRAVKDMRMSGINPMVAFGAGGATTPGGAQARVEDVIGPAISNAMQGKRMMEEIKLVQQSIEESAARTAEAHERATNAGIEGDLMRLSLPAARNAARVEENIGTVGSWADRINRVLFGGRGIPFIRGR